eukprot:scaffold182375_cov43-Prasinocladus_malaysianus.AAC.1
MQNKDDIYCSNSMLTPCFKTVVLLGFSSKAMNDCISDHMSRQSSLPRIKLKIDYSFNTPRLREVPVLER